MSTRCSLLFVHTRSSSNLSVSFSFFSHSLLKIAAISFKLAVKLFFFFSDCLASVVLFSLLLQPW